MTEELKKAFKGLGRLNYMAEKGSVSKEEDDMILDWYYMVLDYLKLCEKEQVKK